MLRDTDHPYRIDLKLAAGTTHAHARGRLLDRCACAISTCSWAIGGKSMADLFPLIGVATPPTPATNWTAIWGRTGDVWH